MRGTLADRLAKAEAALAQGPGGMACYSREMLASVLHGMGRPADDEALSRAQGELRHDLELQAAWRAAGYEINEVIIFLYASDWNL